MRNSKVELSDIGSLNGEIPRLFMNRSAKTGDLMKVALNFSFSLQLAKAVTIRGRNIIAI